MRRRGKWRYVFHKNICVSLNVLNIPDSLMKCKARRGDARRREATRGEVRRGEAKHCKCNTLHCTTLQCIAMRSNEMK